MEDVPIGYSRKDGLSMYKWSPWNVPGGAEQAVNSLLVALSRYRGRILHQAHHQSVDQHYPGKIATPIDARLLSSDIALVVTGYVLGESLGILFTLWRNLTVILCSYFMYILSKVYKWQLGLIKSSSYHIT